MKSTRSIALSGAVLLTQLSFSEEVTIAAARDNTLYEDASGSLSNGAGQSLFAGKTGTGGIRRALIAFDVAGAVPAGSTITAVTLRLQMSRTRSGGQAVGLHRLLG